MSERSLVVHQDALATLESTMAEATTAIAAQIADLLQRVDELTPSWEVTSESHLAQAAYQRRLLDGVERLTDALAKIKAGVATYREDARDIELENIAVVG